MQWIKLNLRTLSLISIVLLTALFIFIPPSTNFSQYTKNIIAGKTTVEDSVTGLMWEGTTGSQKNWEGALTYCEATMDGFGGYSDWRLPNVKELSSILDLTKSSPAADEDYFVAYTQDYYWASSTYAYNSGYAWCIDFDFGYVLYDVKTNNNYVRCVRNLP